MPAYYAKRALEILHEDDPLALIGAAKRQNEWIKRHLSIKKNYALANVHYTTVADPYKIVKVNSNQITKYLKERPWKKRWEVWGGVVDGKWDVENTIPIKEYPHYCAFRNHFKYNIPWKHTCIIDYVVNSKQKKELPYEGCETKEQLREFYIKYYKKYDQLYTEIQKNGFQVMPMEGLGIKQAPHTIIGRDGELIFRGQGHHRIAIAKILELDNIPVYIYVRHKQWQKLRDKIHNNGLPEGREDLRDHPDLRDVIDD